MTVVGQFCLLLAMVCSGYAAFAAILGNLDGTQRAPTTLARSARFAGLAAFVALTAIVAILAYALVTKDFRFEYVTEYSDPLLPWHYSLSALWVGQAGSLLVWGWFVAALAMVFWATSCRVAQASGAPAQRADERWPPESKSEIGGPALATRSGPTLQPFSGELWNLAFGVQMTYLAFLLAIMVFAVPTLARTLSASARCAASKREAASAKRPDR